MVIQKWPISEIGHVLIRLSICDIAIVLLKKKLDSRIILPLMK